MGYLKQDKIREIEKQLEELYGAIFRAEDKAKKHELEATRERGTARMLDQQITDLIELIKVMEVIELIKVMEEG